MPCATERHARLFVQQVFPVWRYKSFRSGNRLIRWMRLRRRKVGTGEDFLRAIIEKPALARFEAPDDRVARRGVVFGGVLVRRTVAAADMTAFGTSAEMKPPVAAGQAFDAAGAARQGFRVDAIFFRFHGRTSTKSRGPLITPEANIAMIYCKATGRETDELA